MHIWGGELSYKMRVRLRMTCIWRYNVWVGWVVRGVGEGIKGQVYRTAKAASAHVESRGPTRRLSRGALPSKPFDTRP